MRELSLLPVPNQRLSAVLGGVLWDIEIKTLQAHMAASFWVDGELLLQGQRIVCNAPMIPYRYLATSGNFVIVTPGDADLDWQQFGVSQSLFFIEPGELP